MIRCAASSHDVRLAKNYSVNCCRQQTPFVLFRVAAHILTAGERHLTALAAVVPLIAIVHAVCCPARIRRTCLAGSSQRDPDLSELHLLNSTASLQFSENASRRWLSRKESWRLCCKKRPTSLVGANGDCQNTRRPRPRTGTAAAWPAGCRRRPAVPICLPCSRELASPTTPEPIRVTPTPGTLSTAFARKASETDGRLDVESLPLPPRRTRVSSLCSGNAELTRTVRRSEIRGRRLRKTHAPREEHPDKLSTASPVKRHHRAYKQALASASRSATTELCVSSRLAAIPLFVGACSAPPTA